MYTDYKQYLMIKKIPIYNEKTGEGLTKVMRITETDGYCY